MTKYIRILLNVMLMTCLLGVIATNVSAQDPDLPGPASNLQLIPAGSLVIPMDNDKQNLGPLLFNLAAYGLVNDLLQSDIPVKWAILAGKAKDDPDFSADATGPKGCHPHEHGRSRHRADDRQAPHLLAPAWSTGGVDRTCQSRSDPGPFPADARGGRVAR